LTSLTLNADTFRKGAAGEVELDAVLQRLVDRGWHPLPDRRSPTGGTIDELFVSRAGIAVLDPMKWG
jgi:hypothetical protein